jgi:uncharacterized RDD family membrane protein YckC
VPGQPPATGEETPPRDVQAPPPPGYAPPPPGYAPPPPGYKPPPPGYRYPPPPGSGYPPPGYQPQPPPVSPSGRPLAEFGERLLAYLIDYAILFAISTVILIPIIIAQFRIVLGPMDDLDRRIEADSPPAGEVMGELLRDVIGPLVGLWAATLLILLLIHYVYHVELMFRSGQTVGKRIMKLQVVTLDPAQSVTRTVATKRWAVESVALLVPGFVYLDGLWQLWDKPYRQCLHDKVAVTTVVKVGP